MEEEGEGLGGGRHGEACSDTLSTFILSLILLYRGGGGERGELKKLSHETH